MSEDKKEVIANPVTVNTEQKFTRPSRPVPKFETKKFGREVNINNKENSK